MRILLSAGKNTINIKEQLDKANISGSIEITYENYIKDIGRFISRGDHFDRALILKKSWQEDEKLENEDGSIADEEKIRENIREVTKVVRDRLPHAECIFIVENDVYGDLIYEEIIDIINQSVILKKYEGKYHAKYFINLVMCEIDSIPNNLIYVHSNLKETEIKKIEDRKKDIEEVDDIGLITSELGIRESSSFEDDFDTSNEFDSLDNFEDEEEFDLSEDNNLDYEELNTEEIRDTDFIVEQENNGLFEDEEVNDFEGFESFGDTEDLEDAEEFRDAEDFEDAEEFENFESAEDFGYEDENQEDININVDELLNNFEDSSLDEEDSIDNMFEEETAEEFNIEESTELELEETNEIVKTSDNINKKDNKRKLFGGFNKKEKKKTNEKQIQATKPNTIKEEIQTEIGVEETDSVDLFKYENDKEVIKAGVTIKGLKGKNNKLNNIDTKDAILNKFMSTFKTRGNTITITGTRCSGKTTIAYNLGNLINKMGYTVLIVDLDTRNKGQTFISKEIYETVHSANEYSTSLKSAINSTKGLANNIIIKPGLNMLTMGLMEDSQKPSEVIRTENLNRFINNARMAYNFIIFDVTFEDLVSDLKDILITSDELILTTNTNHHGLMEFLNIMANIEDNDIRDLMFNSSYIVFNKIDNLKKLFGIKINSLNDVLRVLDKKVTDLIGYQAEHLFQDIKIGGAINMSSYLESCWYSNTQLSDTKDGELVILEILRRVLLNEE